MPTKFVPDKPFKTYKEQITHLRDVYGLIIPPGQESFAEQALSDISYYDLVNGYKECMMVDEHFKSGVTLQFLYMFYLFDKGFQSLLLRFALIVENSFKTKLAYTLAQHYGVEVEDYLHARNFPAEPKGKTSIYATLASIRKNLSPKSSKVPTQYYIKHHNHVPPWILFKNVSFSNAINLFALLESPQKLEIINAMLPPTSIKDYKKNDFFIRGLNLIREFRNVMAHNQKFVTFKTEKNKLGDPEAVISLFPAGLLTWTDVKRHDRGLNDIYSLILLVATMLGTSFLQFSFLHNIFSYLVKTPDLSVLAHKHLIPQYKAITKLPDNLEDRIFYYLSGDKLHPSSNIDRKAAEDVKEKLATETKQLEREGE